MVHRAFVVFACQGLSDSKVNINQTWIRVVKIQAVKALGQYRSSSAHRGGTHQTASSIASRAILVASKKLDKIDCVGDFPVVRSIGRHDRKVDPNPGW